MARTPSTAATQTPAADKAETPVVVAKETVKPVVAKHRINGSILPGTIFTPELQAQREELFKLKAVDEPTEADVALFKAQVASNEAVDLG